MTSPAAPAFDDRTIDTITIDDERSFRHVGLYADLKAVLRKSKYRFRVVPPGRGATWDRALFLNLTFWSAESGGDVLVDDHLAADVVAHVAWHHLAARAFAEPAGVAPTVEALFLGEAIASAFDLYLVGRLLGHSPKSDFLATQVPAMSDAAGAAGASEAELEALLESVAADPDLAFSDLRSLLSSATAALYRCTSAEDAFAVLAALDAHRFGVLLHRYELSNWVLYARAYGRDVADPRVRAVDRSLREEKVALDWLTREWVSPALAEQPARS